MIKLSQPHENFNTATKFSVTELSWSLGKSLSRGGTRPDTWITFVIVQPFSPRRVHHSNAHTTQLLNLEFEDLNNTTLQK
jgi:hypothetical protein